LCGSLVNRGLHLIKLTQVDGQAYVPGAEAGSHLDDCRIAVQQGHLGTALHQQAGAGQTDTGGTASDHGAAAVEVERLVPEIGHFIHSVRAASGPGFLVG